MKTKTSFKKGHKPVNVKRGIEHGRYRHGMYGTPIYKKWMAMKRRCLNKNEKSYERYGGRGIKICDRWLDFEGFYKDMGASFIQGMSLERVNNNGNYEKKNCKWIPLREQARNKRSVILYEYKDKILSIPEWEKLKGFRKDTLRRRLKNLKWSLEEALNTPVSYGNKYRKN